MKVKLSIAKIILASSMLALFVPSQATWAMTDHTMKSKTMKSHTMKKHTMKVHKHTVRVVKAPRCTGKGWHMVSRRCDIKPASDWEHYTSGVYTQPESRRGFMNF